jgi:hypothetical protein
LRHTNSTAALAIVPATVGPVRLPTVIVEPGTKFAPLIVIDRLRSTPYVTGVGSAFEIVGGTASAGFDQHSPTTVTAQPRRARKPVLLIRERVENRGISR